MSTINRRAKGTAGNRTPVLSGGGPASGPSIRELLSGGDLRSIGRVPEVLKIVGENPERLGELVGGLDSEDPVVRGRAADALEKLTAKSPVLLEPFKESLLRVAASSGQQEVRWHLAQMMPRLPLTRREIPSVFSLLRSYLEGRSAIVKVCALQAMVELSLRDPSLRFPAKALAESFCRSGTPAMRARGRKLLFLLKEGKNGL